MKTLTIALSCLLATAATAVAQEEEDHAKTQSGTTEAPPPMRAENLEGSPQTYDIDKTFGIGFGQTPGGVRGFEAEYYLGSVMLDGHIALGLFSPSNGDSSSYFALAGGAFFRWKVYDNVALMLGGRLDFGHAAVGGSTTGPGKLPQVYGSSDSASQINLEFLARVQIYLGMLSLHAEFGPVLAILPDSSGVIGDSWQSVRKGVYFDLPSTNLLANFGAIIYTN